MLDETNQKQIHALASSMAKRLASEAPPDPLKPQNLLAQKLCLNIEKQISAFFERYVAGIKELMLTIVNLHKTQPDIDLGEIFTEFDKLDRGFKALGQNPEETRSLRELCEIHDSSIDVFNAAVAEIYNKKEFERAAKVYGFLNVLEPNQPAYWLGAGNCEFFEKHYDAALPAYEMAVCLDGDNPQFHFNLAHCYHELQQNEEAVREVDQALALIKLHSEMSDQLEQGEKLKEYFGALTAKR